METHPPARVLMQAADAPTWRGLAEVCLAAGDFYLVPCGTDPAVVIPLAEDMAPCTLVLSLDVARQCIEQLRATIRRVPGLRVLIRGKSSRADLEEFLAMGVVGFVPADAAAARLHTALKAISKGEIWASRVAVSSVLTKLVFQASAKVLSGREREILRCITKGHKNREIADRLCISRDTVRWHIRSLYSKIGASDRLSAVMYGRRFLIDDGPGAEMTTSEPGEHSVQGFEMS